LSLVGNLEDLGLGDILQIVSLSRKSGVLNLTCESRKGKILFRDGQVVSAVSNEIPARFDTLIAKDGDIRPESVAEAVALKRGIGKDKSLNDILVERLGINPEVIESRIREYVENVVFRFFGWTEGNFNFDVKEGFFEQTELSADSEGILLHIGLNPQFLAMEGTRLQDEARRAASQAAAAKQAEPPQTAHIQEEHPGTQEAIQAPPPQPIPHETPPSEATRAAAQRAEIDLALAEESQIPQVLIIDDDPEIITLVKERLRGLGLTGEGVLKVSEALRRLDELLAHGHCPVLIADLFMPRTDGEGILGGLELVQTVKTRTPFVPIVLTSDYPNEAAEKEARSMGLDLYLDKPKRSQIWGDKPTPELARFTERLRDALPDMVLKAVIPRQEPAVVPQTEIIAHPDGLVDLGREIRQELGEAATPSAHGEEAPQMSRGLNLLKMMINELNDPSFSGQITLMVLRFAAEMMNRAIIFLVARDQVAGLGQFGVELNGIDPLRQVRRMRIPISEPSIFREVMQKRAVYKKPLPDTEWNNYLVRHLGGVRPVESFGAPIIAGGKIAAILYGDNVMDQMPIGDTDSLEIFLAQAGLAMERAFLERRISELSLRHR